jgi:hypothetical protein
MAHHFGTHLRTLGIEVSLGQDGPVEHIPACLMRIWSRLMMNTNGFPIGAAPGSLSSEDRIKP